MKDIILIGEAGKTYNIGRNSERSNLQVVDTICDHLDLIAPSLQGPHRRLIVFVADRPGHDRQYAIDANFINQQLNWFSRVNFEEGIPTTLCWFCADKDRWSEACYSASRLGLLSAAAGR
jgi:dTDP-glucose 4,6-dehydratase